MNSTVTQFAQPGDEAVSPITQILQGTWDDFRREVVDEQVPLHLFNESVFRWLFARRVMQYSPRPRVDLEWNKFDLLLVADEVGHIVEFKFYAMRLFHHDLDGHEHRDKGGPSKKNVSEFCECIEKLRDLKSSCWRGRSTEVNRIASRSIILVFSDDSGEKRKSGERNKKERSFADSYLSPSDRIVDCCGQDVSRVEPVDPFPCSSPRQFRLYCHLYQVSGVVPRTAN